MVCNKCFFLKSICIFLKSICIFKLGTKKKKKLNHISVNFLLHKTSEGFLFEDSRLSTLSYNRYVKSNLSIERRYMDQFLRNLEASEGEGTYTCHVIAWLMILLYRYYGIWHLFCIALALLIKTAKYCFTVLWRKLVNLHHTKCNCENSFPSIL